MPAPRTQVRPPTVGEVARRAHVSRATVSRVLNRYPHVRSRVRSAVQEAMRALGYRPGQLARSLARRETQTLGLIVADITNPFYAETPRAAVEAVRDRGCNVILCNTDSRPRLHEEYVEGPAGPAGGGIVFGSVFLHDSVVENLVRTGYPCIVYNQAASIGAGELHRAGQRAGQPGPDSSPARPGAPAHRVCQWPAPAPHDGPEAPGRTGRRIPRGTPSSASGVST